MLGRSGCACSSSLLAMFRQEFELSLLPGQIPGAGLQL